MSSIKPIIRELREAVLAGTIHSKHRLHVLAENLDGHFDTVVKRVKDQDTYDAAPVRIDVSVKPFARNRNHNEIEYNRQLKEQMDALHNVSIADWLKNRTEYLRNGRTGDSVRAQQNARENALSIKIAELRASGQTRADASRNAHEWLSGQAATHRLDGIAGGNASDISGVGDSRVNSSLGSQWRSRVTDLDAAVSQFIVDNPHADFDNTFMNVAFR